MREPALPVLLTEVHELLAQANHAASALLVAARAQQGAAETFALTPPSREADA